MSTAVLVVEDEPALARNIVAFLSGSGFDARSAASAEEALRELESFRPEAVLLDINLPGMNGLKALGHMREADPRLKVVVMTGHATVEVAVDAMKAGAYDFVTKPVSLSRLKLLLESPNARNVLQPLRKLAPPDLIPATQIASTADWAKIYFLSRMPEATVESLHMTALGNDREAARLLAGSDKCVLIGGAQNTFGEVAG